MQAAVDAWAQKSGNTVNVIAAKDLNQQLGQALAGGDPPDVFYVNADKFQEYASGGSLAAVGDQIDEPGRLLPGPAPVVHLRRQALLRAEGLLHARAWSSTPTCWAEAGLTDADYPKTWDELSAGGHEADHRRPGRPGLRRHPRPGRRVHGRRPAATSSTRTRPRSPPTRRRTWPRSSSCRACSRRQLQVHREHGPRLGRRGDRHGRGRDDDRGQLDPRRDDERLPEHQLHRGRAAEGPSGNRARWRSPSAGASPPAATSRTPRSTSSTS